MMSVETMRSVNPKTVDRSTLVQRTASGLSLRMRRITGCWTLSGRSKIHIVIWTERPCENHLLEDRHHLGGLSGTLSERTLIMNKLNLFARFYGQAIEPVIQ